MGHFEPGRQASDLLDPTFSERGGSQARQNRGLQGEKVSRLARKTV